MQVARVVSGDLPASDYSPVHLLVEAEGADQWHSFNITDTYGLLSKFAEMIPDQAVFAIPELRGELFSTESIKLIVEAARLKGLYFREIDNRPWAIC